MTHQGQDTAPRFVPVQIESIAESILETQKPNGEIPWSTQDKTDPWDHVEAAMGLTIAGHYTSAKKAFDWLCQTQMEDGSWFAEYKNDKAVEKRKDANMTAYIAVGAYHYYLVTGDRDFLAGIWKPVEKAINFTLGLQAHTGEIHWARLDDGTKDPMALLTGSSSIFMSIKCALAIAGVLGKKKPGWKKSLYLLQDAIANKPHLFNMTKSRFSMDWFYPVLSGAVTDEAAKKRIRRLWKKFVVKGQGVLCVSDEPWVTIAETSELCLALCAMGDTTLANILFNWILDKRFEDGSYWCGYTYPDMVIWPEEKMSWTNGVVLMACDALYNLTPGAKLFDHESWKVRLDNL